jgi:hypothetical protein
MTKDFGERENSRVRDLVDRVILHEQGLLSAGPVAVAVMRVWSERESAAPPADLPQPPRGWDERYGALAAELGLRAQTLSEAAAVITALWAEMFPTEKS